MRHTQEARTLSGISSATGTWAAYRAAWTSLGRPQNATTTFVHPSAVPRGTEVGWEKLTDWFPKLERDLVVLHDGGCIRLWGRGFLPGGIHGV